VVDLLALQMAGVVELVVCFKALNIPSQWGHL